MLLRLIKVIAALLSVSVCPVFAAEDHATVFRTNRPGLMRYAAQSGERIWTAALDPDRRNPSSRDLFTYALALCEAGTHPERLARLFEVAGQMQDRSPGSRGFGNFRWSWAHTNVADFNAVDFCMQGGALLWLRHRHAMPAAARARLREIFGCAVEGLKRHRVAAHYTNIALMNAADLILLGEALGESATADEGYSRLDRVVWYTWENGIHEYCSPTYYGVDLDDLVLIEAFCQRERGRQQARALLELFWTDIALNWFPGAQKLGGTRSRDYDYLRGLGILDNHLWAAGWLDGPVRGGLGILWPAPGRWAPPRRLRELSERRLPRLVRQKWGPAEHAVRTHYLLPDVTLGVSGEYYGGWMDLPLTVDLAGPRESVRCYYLPDGRHDPYGKIRIPAGPHSKTLHLGPFFAGAQRKTDALALTVYRTNDVPMDAPSLETHFVMPLAADGVWIGERKIQLTPAQPVSIPLGAHEVLAFRKGTAAVGVRVPWSCDAGGRPASVVFVWDTNDYGATRLTVNHRWPTGSAAARSHAPGAALWVRVGGGLTSENAFTEWQLSFSQASAEVKAGPRSVSIRVQGQGGGVAVGAEDPFQTCSLMEPAPSPIILGLEAEDLAKGILKEVEPVKTILAEQGQTRLIEMPAAGAVYWEAARGAVLPGMERNRDAKASGGMFVWSPGEAGGKGSGSGSVSWRLRIAEAGDYELWGRVRSPTPDDDSFFLSVMQSGRRLFGPVTWGVGVHRDWEWTRLAKPGAPNEGLRLPAGEVTLRLDAREDGAAIDRLFLTRRKTDRPQ